MSTDSTLSSSNKPSTSSDCCNDAIKVDAQNSNVNINRGDNNIFNQYQGVPPSQVPPERIEYNVQDPIMSFTGREDVIQALHEAIEHNRKSGDLTVLAQANVLTGLGGIGKTETVRKYIQQYKENYGHVLWINAETHTQAKECVIGIATRTNVISFENIDGAKKKDEELADDVYNFICQKPAFIVFDNANSLLGENGKDGLGPLLPRSIKTRSVKPSIVVTTRNRKWRNCKVIPLSGFNDEESFTLLMTQLEFKDTEENRSNAAEIIKLCDGLPLVIQQVIGVIKMESDEREAVGEEAYSMQDFLKEYHEGSKSYVDETPNDVAGDLGVSYTVYSVFNMTFQKISQKRGGELALQCLNILALLNPDGIPVDLLLSFFDNEIRNSIKKSLTLLVKYNLINVADKFYTVHRMLQKVRIQMLRNVFGQKELLRETIISSSTKFGKYLESLTPNNIRKFMILENGMRLANLVFKEKCGKNTYNFLDILAGQLVSNGKYYNAIYILKFMLESDICNTEDVPKYQQKLASTYRLEGKLLESEQMYLSLLACDISKIHEHACESSNKLFLIYHLAEVYLDQGKYGQAQSLLNYVITHQTVILGSKHSETLLTKETLAKVCQRLGNYDEAEQLNTEVLKSKIITLGPDHPSTLTTKNNLGLVFTKKGMLTKAEELFTEILRSEILILGPDHPSTLTKKII